MHAFLRVFKSTDAVRYRICSCRYRLLSNANTVKVNYKMTPRDLSDLEEVLQKLFMYSSFNYGSLAIGDVKGGINKISSG
jgi:hypothetical protein